MAIIVLINLTLIPKWRFERTVLYMPRQNCRRFNMVDLNYTINLCGRSCATTRAQVTIRKSRMEGSDLCCDVRALGLQSVLFSPGPWPCPPNCNPTPSLTPSWISMEQVDLPSSVLTDWVGFESIRHGSQAALVVEYTLVRKFFSGYADMYRKEGWAILQIRGLKYNVPIRVRYTA